ncbi:DNA-binding protein [Streptomyces griseocarneus]|nr:DNA-binding protein [Streptomyces griseocarneus]
MKRVDPSDELPHLFRPTEIAKALGCSEWWLKEQARRRRVPFTRVGGAYRFTIEHVAEVIDLFEERPLQPGQSASGGVMARARKPRSPELEGRLRARSPRRALQSEQTDSPHRRVEA